MTASMPAKNWTLSATPRPLPANGGTVRDLLHFLSTQAILDTEELAAFASDVEVVQKTMNHQPA